MEPQTSESSEAYLNNLGFRSLIEWMTAESLLSRPDDPLVFLRDLLDEKIAERRKDEKYEADHAMKYIKQCYAVASASADENGRIISKPRKMRNTGKSSTVDQSLINRLAVLERVIQSCRLISMELEPDKANQVIIKQVCAILNSERATLFTYDKVNNILVLQVSEGVEDMIVPFGKGIAGQVAASGKVLNIEDAYSSPIFDSQYDKNTGYRTKTILCAPIRDGKGEIVGVVQALNKIGSNPDSGKSCTFTDSDADIITIFSTLAGVVLHNAGVHQMAVKLREQLKDVLSIVHEMHRDLGFNPLMFTISTRVQKLLSSDRCTLYIVDQVKNELWTLQGEVNIRVPINSAIAGAVVNENATINIADAYQDPRFNKEYDQKLNYRTKSVLAMPLLNRQGEIIAVVQLINKLERPGVFTPDDEELLGTFLQIAGPILESYETHLSKTAMTEEVGTEYTGKTASRGVQDVIEMNVIAENDGDEEIE